MAILTTILILLAASAAAGAILVFYPEIKEWMLKSNSKIGRFLKKLFRVS